MTKEDNLKALLQGEKFFFSNPLEIFLDKTRAGAYTRTFQKEKRLLDRISLDSLQEYYTQMLKELTMRNNRDGLFLQKKQNAKSLLTKRNAVIDLEDVSVEESEGSFQSISDISIEKYLSDISEGETHYASAGEENFQKIEIGDIDEEIQENRRLEAQKAMTLEALKSKKQPEKELPEPIMTSQASQSSKAQKATKNVVTIKANPREWVEQYRQQERERYANPTKPWTYVCYDDAKAIVAPVAKKISMAQNSKPREHFLLKADRPSYITILCLVRDAAA